MQKTVTSLGLAAIAATIALTPATAWAEGPVTSRPKGMIGGGLLGAELALITTAIIDPDPWWPYLVFGLVGAGGGVAGGWAVEEASVDGDTDTAEPSLYMLAGGMALVVPTLVAVLNATAYEPEEEEVQDDGDELPGEDVPGVDVEGGVELETGLLQIDAFGKTRVRMGVPAVSVGPRFTPVEIATYGVAQATQVHVPVVSGSF